MKPLSRITGIRRMGGIWLALALIGLVIASGSSQPVPVGAQEPAPLWGIADTHNHQFANLGFGGLMIWGDVFRWDDNIAKALPWSDFMPGRYGDVLNYGGTSRELDVSAWSPLYPNVPATCPPGTGGLFQPPCRGFSIHGSNGTRDLLNYALSGNFGHSTAGYPRFDGYPRWDTYTGQQMYYKWLERAWRDGGLRLMVMFAVNNEALCEAIDRKARYTCEDMPAIDRQIQAAKDLERFIDNQYGGPGQGWYRIAYSPAQAREIVASGKLAVVLGIETPSLFGCKVNSDCTAEYVLTELRRYRDMGVRHIYPLHNADNGFGGTGLYNDLFTINTKAINGEWFDVTNQCDPRIDFHLDLLDWLQDDDGSNPDPVVGFARLLLSILTGQNVDPPRPPAGPNCNARDLQPLGETLIAGLMDLKMIVDVDHLSRATFNDVMAMVEGRQYPGIVSSHAAFVDMGIPRPAPDAKSIRHEANKTPEELARIRALGGLLGVIIHQGDRSVLREYVRPDGSIPVPYRCGGSSEAWAQAYLYAVDQMQGNAVALATDMNGLAGLPAPRFGLTPCGGDMRDLYVPANPVAYSSDPAQGLTKMQVGEKLFDYNHDGFANVGMLPDFIQDARNIGMSEADLAPLFKSAEAYIRMWERVGDFAPDPGNSAPTAYAGGPYLAQAGTTITLHGTGSDPDGDAVTFSWDLDGNGVFETAGASVTFPASGRNRDVSIVMRACDIHAAGSESVCTTSRTFVHVRTPGHIYAWGGNALGQLGVPPAAVPFCGAPNRCSPSPVSVPGLLDVVDVAAGHRRSVALTSSGTVWVWGADTGSTPVQMGELGGVVAISAGNEHTLALKSDGSVWAWGANQYGQLGLGDRTNHDFPVQVPTGGRIIAISAGDRFSLALRDNGDILGWGYNHDYQLGSQCWQGGDITIPPGECLSPAVVFGFGGPDIVAIAAGSTWSHALDTSGAVWAQGGVFYETGQPRTLPFRVGGLTLSTAISAGTGDHVLALRGDGYVWGYGRNAWGQVNLEECRDANDFCWPSEGSTYGQKVAIAAGYGHSLALHADGTITTWGTNFDGQLGRGTWGETGTMPEWIRLLRGAIAIAAGYDHSLAIVPTTVSFTAQPNAWANFYLPGKCFELDGDVDCAHLSVTESFTQEAVTLIYTFQHAPSAQATSGLGSSLKYTGSSFTLAARDASGNPVTSFPSRLGVNVYYGDADWQQAGIVDELMLDVYKWNEESSQWQASRPLCSVCSRIYPGDNHIWLLLDQLGPQTEFALIGLLDTTPPEVTATVAPQANAAGWNNSEVAVTVDAADEPGGSGVLSLTYSATGAQAVAQSTVNGDTATITIGAKGETSLSYFAEDNAHNVSVPTVTRIKIDRSSPSTAIAVTGQPGQNDWFVSDLGISLSGTDNLSGLNHSEYSLDGGATYAAYAAPFAITQEGTTTILARSVDNADNVESPAKTVAVKLDKTAPIITIASPEPFAVLPVSSILTFGAGDAVSGIQSTSATLSDGSTTVTVSSGHAIMQAGIYTLVVQATDVAGNESTETRSFVVYDPSGGFVSGGGLIDSPAGAYTAEPTLAGKATFGFVSKYLKGATVPTGSTRFAFRVADLSFQSSSYEWLVVNQAGTNAQFKGSGTINGTGDYRFMLWAGDGTPDTFRIRIWEEADGVETVIYDNGAEQPIAGGSILVHKN